VPEELQKKLQDKFRGMMSALYKEKGASLRIEILEEPEVLDFIGTHSEILDSSFSEVRMSDVMRERLSGSDWMFPGMKTFLELNESFPSLLDEEGNRKPFEQFLNDVQSIDSTYNRNYLNAEYNFAQASAGMAARWEDFAEDGDDYLLQYRTAGDDKVRPEHAELNGVTLPASDTFWDTYYPPNGWNCRCTVVQVLKEKYEQTPHEEAIRRGESAMSNERTARMFAFNPGKQQKVFPDYNPYTIRKCLTCPKALKLVEGTPSGIICATCAMLKTCRDDNAYYPDSETGKRLMISSRADLADLEKNITTARQVLSVFRDSTMTIRHHFSDGRKNPEYTIDGLIADRKGIKGSTGITNGFRNGLKQGCRAIVFDLNEYMSAQPLPANLIALKLQGREADFREGKIERCYIVYKNNVFLITKQDFSFGEKEKTVPHLRHILEQNKG